MSWHKIVFSESTRLRYRRHAFFWLVWLFYFGSTFFYKQQPFIKDSLLLWIFLVLIKSIFLLLGHAFICYAALYFLLPRFLKGKYLNLSLFLLAAGLVVTAWIYFCYDRIFPLIDGVLYSTTAVTKSVLLWNSLTAGVLSALKLVAIAITIKLLKHWWITQDENLRLEKEKINAELQLLKAQIHPDFLFSSLDKIYYYAQNDTDKASWLLLKLSDLLSYMLYECNQPYVPLEKEIAMLRDYVELEKRRLGGKLDIDIQVKGDTAGKLVAPLLLLPFVENCFLFCGNKDMEKCWLNIDLRTKENYFSMKLINGKSNENIAASVIEEGLKNVRKRLDVLYRNHYELKLTIEQDFMISLLKIDLNELIEPQLATEITPANSGKENQQTAYASV